MKAVGYFTAGPLDRTDALIDLDVPMPTPGPQDLLVKVAAISVLTNLAAGLREEPSHEQTLKFASLGAGDLSRLIVAFLEERARRGA